METAALTMNDEIIARLTPYDPTKVALLDDFDRECAQSLGDRDKIYQEYAVRLLQIDTQLMEELDQSDPKFPENFKARETAMLNAAGGTELKKRFDEILKYEEQDVTALFEECADDLQTVLAILNDSIENQLKNWIADYGHEVKWDKEALWERINSGRFVHLARLRFKAFYNVLKRKYEHQTFNADEIRNLFTPILGNGLPDETVKILAALYEGLAPAESFVALITDAVWIQHETLAEAVWPKSIKARPLPKIHTASNDNTVNNALFRPKTAEYEALRTSGFVQLGSEKYPIGALTIPDINSTDPVAAQISDALKELKPAAKLTLDAVDAWVDDYINKNKRAPIGDIVAADIPLRQIEHIKRTSTSQSGITDVVIQETNEMVKLLMKCKIALPVRMAEKVSVIERPLLPAEFVHEFVNGQYSKCIRLYALPPIYQYAVSCGHIIRYDQRLIALSAGHRLSPRILLLREYLFSRIAFSYSDRRRFPPFIAADKVLLHLGVKGKTKYKVFDEVAMILDSWKQPTPRASDSGPERLQLIAGWEDRKSGHTRLGWDIRLRSDNPIKRHTQGRFTDLSTLNL